MFVGYWCLQSQSNGKVMGIFISYNMLYLEYFLVVLSLRLMSDNLARSFL